MLHTWVTWGEGKTWLQAPEARGPRRHLRSAAPGASPRGSGDKGSAPSSSAHTSEAGTGGSASVFLLPKLWKVPLSGSRAVRPPGPTGAQHFQLRPRRGGTTQPTTSAWSPPSQGPRNRSSRPEAAQGPPALETLGAAQLPRSAGVKDPPGPGQTAPFPHVQKEQLERAAGRHGPGAMQSSCCPCATTRWDGATLSPRARAR